MDGRGRHGERRHRGVGAVASAPAAFRVRVWNSCGIGSCGVPRPSHPCLIPRSLELPLDRLQTSSQPAWGLKVAFDSPTDTCECLDPGLKRDF